MLKRFVALFLAALMMLSVLCACTETPVEDKQEDAEEQAERGDSDYRDFYEEEFWAAYMITASENNYFWPEPVTQVEERTRKVSKEVEELLNCKLKEEGFGGGSLSTSAWQSRFAVGDYRFSWTSAAYSTTPVYAFYKAGFIQSWNNIPGVDLDNEERWGSKRNQSNATFDGELYLASTAQGGGGFGRLIFNKLLAVELTGQSPQEIYEADNWTWDTFETYLETCRVDEADRYVRGMSVYAISGVPQSQLPLCAVFSNGGEVVRFDEHGKARFALGDADALEALTWANELVRSGNVVFDTVLPPDTWAKERTVFVLGDAAFGTAASGVSEHWGLDNLEDIRFIPFPIGPKGDKNTDSGTFSTAASGTVLLFGIDKENAGYVWNVKLECAEKYRNDTDMEWKRKTFFQDDNNDDDSYNNYSFGTKNYEFDYTTQIGDKSSLMQETLYDIVIGKKTPVAGIQEITGAISANLDVSYNN